MEEKFRATCLCAYLKTQKCRNKDGFPILGHICGIAGENRPSGAKTKNELFISCCSPYLALSSGACGASIRAFVPEL